MKNKLLAMLILAGISSSSYAYTIISESYVCKGNKGGECRIIHYDAKSKSVGASVGVSDQNAKSGEATQVRAHHEVYMRNGDDHKKRYHYHYSIGCDQMYNVFERDIDLDGHEEFSDSADTVGTVQIISRQNFDIVAATEISKAESDRKEAHATLHVR